MTSTQMSSTAQPSNNHVKDAEAYFGNVFGQGFDDKFNAADKGTVTTGAAANPVYDTF